MSRIYSALEKAQHFRKDKAGQSRPLPTLPAPPGPADPNMEAEMLELYRTVETLLPQLQSRVLQFIGSREGEGTSTVVREFARVSATRIGKSVLVLDADRHRSSRHHLLGEHSEFGWIEAIETGKSVEEAIYQMGKSSLYFSPSCNSSTSTPQIFDSPRIEDLWSNLRTRFDLVLIDSAPLSMSPDGLAIASRVDGVVIVLEAEKTHWRAVKNVEESIRKVEGNILGLVFNKRRYYLPDFIYKLL